jgi:leucyl/phenylalanyl-tRNA--protein transferase
MNQRLHQLDAKTINFPDLAYSLSEPNGLLAVGGDLSPARLLAAYQQGIFPWYGEHDPIMWWSPNPRAIISIDELRINRSLRKAIKKNPFEITINQDFAAVTQWCADAPFRDDDTWILPDMERAYLALHELGFAHSIEIWQPDNNGKKLLVGGLYGLAINGYFSGESMFYKESNASKFALVALAQLLHTANISFIDCQLLNPFLQEMGAKEIPRSAFVKRLNKAKATLLPQDFWQTRHLTIS